MQTHYNASDIKELHHGTIKISEVLELIYRTKDIIFDEDAVSSVKVKGAADYVTRVDVGVQDFLQKELAARYPEIGFIGEEQEQSCRSPEKSYWILDPIDGTTNLIHHYRMSAVSLGLYEKGEITFGAVYNPFSGEMYTASAGEGAYLNGKQIRVSAIDDISYALVAYGSSPYEKERSRELFPVFERIFLSCADFRRSGSAALELCYVACGRHEVYLEQNLKPWDYAAGALILKEAGGRIETWQGTAEPPYIENADIFAANDSLAEPVKRILRG